MELGKETSIISTSTTVTRPPDLLDKNIGPPSVAPSTPSGHRHNVSATSIETVWTDSAIGESESSKRSSLDRRSQSSTSVDWIETSGGSPQCRGITLEGRIMFGPNGIAHTQLASDDPDRIEILPSADDRKSNNGGLFSKNLFSRKHSSTGSTGSGMSSASPQPQSTSNPLARLFGGNRQSAAPQAVSVSTTALILEDRPSNLPSKSREEQERHQKMYQEMVEAARKKELKEQKQRQKQQSVKNRHETQIATAAHMWTTDFLPNFEEKRNTKQCLELWWHGLPSCVRGRVWSMTIANQLNITKDLYQICCTRARERLLAYARKSSSSSDQHPNVSSPHVDAEDDGSQASTSSSTATLESRPERTPPVSLKISRTYSDVSSSSVNRESTIELIHMDVQRTFQSLCIFQAGGPYHEMLMDLLGAYACYRPDIGYVQGMSFVAALLLLNMDAVAAFIAFANMLNWPLQRALYCIRQPDMTHYFIAYDQYFAQQLPALHEHFDELDIRPDLYLIEWLYTIYAKPLALDVACRVWDLYLRDGDEVLFNTALGILALFEDDLMSYEFDQAVQLLSHLPQDAQAFDANKLFDHVSTMPTFRNTGKILLGAAAKRKTFNELHKLVTQRLTVAADGTASFSLHGHDASGSSLHAVTVTSGHSRGPSDTSSIGSSSNHQMKMSKSISGFMQDWLASASYGDMQKSLQSHSSPSRSNSGAAARRTTVSTRTHCASSCESARTYAQQQQGSTTTTANGDRTEFRRALSETPTTPMAEGRKFTDDDVTTPVAELCNNGDNINNSNNNNSSNSNNSNSNNNSNRKAVGDVEDRLIIVHREAEDVVADEQGSVVAVEKENVVVVENVVVESETVEDVADDSKEEEPDCIVERL